VKEDQKISCCICGKEMHLLHHHVKYAHNMTIQDYKNKYPDCPIESFHLKEKRATTLRDTVIRKYGVDNVTKVPSISRKQSNSLKITLNNMRKTGEFDAMLLKRSKTLIDKHGTCDLNSIPYIQSKRRKTLLDRYGVDSPLKNKDILRRKLKNTKFSHTKPNKTELIVIKFSIDGLLFTGGRIVWIELPSYGFKNPDFSYKDGKSFVEVFGAYWHRNHDPKILEDAYARAGLRCLVIQEMDLLHDPEACRTRIISFLS
jgi:hypothetical protein